MANTLVTLFQHNADAQQVAQELREAGFGSSDVNIIDKSAKGSARNIVNTLTSASVPEAAAKVYDEGVRQQNGTLVTLRAEDDEIDKAMAILKRHNAVDLSDRLSRVEVSGSASVDRTRGADQAGAAIPIVEEELQVGKRQVERGGVRVYSHVSERPVEEQVQLREEHVKVERRPADRPASAADFTAASEASIEVTEMAEEAVVSKSARVVEEVIVGKDVRERTETVRDTVRRTDVEVEDVSADVKSKGTKKRQR